MAFFDFWPRTSFSDHTTTPLWQWEQRTVELPASEPVPKKWRKLSGKRRRLMEKRRTDRIARRLLGEDA